MIKGPQLRKKNALFTELQRSQLREVFENNSYPSLSLRKELAQNMCVTVMQIDNWFTNQRYKLRRVENESKSYTSKVIHIHIHMSF